MFSIFEASRATNNLDTYLSNAVDPAWLEATQENDDVPPTPRGESADQYPGPGVCWRSQAGPLPMGLQEMGEEERQVHTS